MKLWLRAKNLFAFNTPKTGNGFRRDLYSDAMTQKLNQVWQRTINQFVDAGRGGYKETTKWEENFSDYSDSAEDEQFPGKDIRAKAHGLVDLSEFLKKGEKALLGSRCSRLVRLLTPSGDY